ncbi:MAG: ABC transporter substrate-binding protein, partial [Candidatus Dormibacteraeota bacterium]|nr:ABC transporter substrate-binding protein [Candidatus Dormibacteraeota bacterium]
MGSTVARRGRGFRASALVRCVGIIAAAGTIAACAANGGSSTQQANPGIVGGKLVIDNESGSTWTCQFNPFNAAVNITSIGFVYEPLEFVNILQTNPDGSSKVTPWLGTSSQWSNNYQTLTFTIRNGVSWSDGQPFSAADVVYTFNALKGDSAIDLNALWSTDKGPLTNVTQQGSNQVVFTFNAPSQSYFYYVADQTPIIPQHIWSAYNQAKLDGEADASPVGTGPYLMSDCSQNNIKYLRNPHYWQASAGHPVPQVQELDYPAFLSNTPANLDLAQGQAQWGAQYIPNIQSYYINKDPAHRHYWFPPTLNVSLFFNLENPLLSNLAVRQAIAMAIDRSQVSQRGESGYEPAANQTGIVLPTYQPWYDSSLNTVTYNPSQAEQVLQQAGFTKNSSGVYQNAQGQPLSFTIKTISGYTDWDASLQVITQELQAIGVQVTVQDETSAPYTTDSQGGNFQLLYGEMPVAGPGPYYELRQLLFSGNIGSTNYSRYSSTSTDALFNEYSGVPLSQQKSIIHQISQVMVQDIPVIPVTEGVDWYQYDTTHFGGWPTAS